MRADDLSLMNRRQALALVLAAGLAPGALLRRATAAQSDRRVLVLAIDGMDPGLTRRFIDQGLMPNAARLAKQGGFSTLGSTWPPQSPVAWATAITGLTPERHGVFDFLHRDAQTLAPFLSTTRVSDPAHSLDIGGWSLPLGAGSVELLRKGKAVWNRLEDLDVPCTVYRVPSNYPPEPSRARTLSGLGTPDLLGSMGSYLYISSDRAEHGRRLQGGNLAPVTLARRKASLQLFGPPNPFRQDKAPTAVPLDIAVDGRNPVARIRLAGQELLLKEGEWSPWVRFRFELLPALAGLDAICRFYLKSASPHLRLYVSPLNIDPANPCQPIATAGFARELAERLGPFPTEGFPVNTKVLSDGVFTDQEYVHQAQLVLGQSLQAYDDLLQGHERGLLFFYFSTLDLNSHMFWRAQDPSHPRHSPELARDFGWFLPELYQTMDRAIGQALRNLGDQGTLLVVSDHGFAPFSRCFNLNSWLRDQGYVALLPDAAHEAAPRLEHVDWTRTKAYGLGLNALYLNLAGREAQGVVQPAEAPALLDELTARLAALRDPKTGLPVLAGAHRPETQGDIQAIAPDLVLGYAPPCRAAWESVLGQFTPDAFFNNQDKWTGDHCMHPGRLSGALLSNRPLTPGARSLLDLAPTLLALFGAAQPDELAGKNMLAG